VYNFDIEKINESVWVFKNAFKNAQEYIDYLEKNQEWKDWYIFGKATDGPEWRATTFTSFPTEEEWQASKTYGDTELGGKNYFANQIDDLFYYATKAYAEANNVSLDNWSVDGWNIAKYIPNPEKLPNYVMMHHTDFQREFSHNPGLKFGVTAVFYLNDNYDGGDIQFRFLDENDSSIIKEDYSYKPKQGDVVVFPSGPPHYHGVKAVLNGEKYIIRNYWRYDYPGHPLWLKLQEKYGEDVWRQLEDQRLKFNRNSDNVTNINNIPFWMGFEEYYKKEIEMLDL
jgi:hypothetical protein